jgi:hypothetical protein
MTRASLKTYDCYDADTAVQRTNVMRFRPQDDSRGRASLDSNWLADISTSRTNYAGLPESAFYPAFSAMSLRSTAHGILHAEVVSWFQAMGSGGPVPHSRWSSKAQGTRRTPSRPFLDGPAEGGDIEAVPDGEVTEAANGALGQDLHFPR